MLKIFLRKRFVCGHTATLQWDEKDKDPTQFIRWINSFNTIEESALFLSFERYKQAVYDRKTKITLEKAEDIIAYFKELRHLEEAECTKIKLS